MFEIIYIIFILSGTIKPFLTYFHIPTIIDFTLLTSLLLGVALLRALFRQQFRVRIDTSGKYALFLLTVLFIVILTSWFYTSSQTYVFTKTLQFFTVLIAFFSPLLIRNFNVDIALKYFLYMSIFLVIIFLPLFIQGYKLFLTNYSRFVIDPIAPVYQSYLPIGYIIGISVLINVFKKFFSSKLRLLITFFLIGALIISGARGPLFSLIGIFMLYAVFIKFSFKLPRTSTLILLFPLFIASGIYLVQKINITDAMERTINRIISIQSEPSANERVLRIEFVFDHLDADHVLQGFGFGSFGNEYSRQDIRSYPHNLILEILFELGILGVLIYIFFILVIIKKLRYSHDFFLWALFIFVFLNSLKSLSLSDSRIFFGFLSLLIVYEKSRRINYDKENE